VVERAGAAALTDPRPATPRAHRPVAAPPLPLGGAATSGSPHGGDRPGAATVPDVATPRPRLSPWVLVLSTVLATAAAVGIYVALDPGDSTTDVVRLTPDDAGPDGGRLLEGGDLAGLGFQDLGGTTTDLADLVGAPLVVNFFGSWCAPCLVEMPAFERVHQDLGSEVTFLGLAVRDRPEDVRRVVAETGVTYRIGRDVDDRVLLAVGGVQMPTTAFVTAEGEVVRVRLGELSEDGLRSLIAEHLGVGT
jgi:cytochrome c biogenesis protein CcmG, thiol:disulfide interchange protein DsbE